MEPVRPVGGGGGAARRGAARRGAAVLGRPMGTAGVVGTVHAPHTHAAQARRRERVAECGGSAAPELGREGRPAASARQGEAGAQPEDAREDGPGCVGGLPDQGLEPKPHPVTEEGAAVAAVGDVERGDRRLPNFLQACGSLPEIRLPS